MIDKATAERFMAVIHKHSEVVTFDLLYDLARALGMTLHVKVIDKAQAGEAGTAETTKIGLVRRMSTRSRRDAPKV